MNILSARTQIQLKFKLINQATNSVCEQLKRLWENRHNTIRGLQYNEHDGIHNCWAHTKMFWPNNISDIQTCSTMLYFLLLSTARESKHGNSARALDGFEKNDSSIQINLLTLLIYDRKILELIRKFYYYTPKWSDKSYEKDQDNIRGLQVASFTDSSHAHV